VKTFVSDEDKDQRGMVRPYSMKTKVPARVAMDPRSQNMSAKPTERVSYIIMEGVSKMPVP